MTYTLKNESGVEKTFADWNLTDVRRTRVNQKSDAVEFTAAGGVDAAPLFAHGEALRLYRGGVPWFAGRVIQVPRAGNPDAEAHRYRVAGPWWYLEDLIFQQNWRQAVDVENPASALADVPRSRVVLGQSIDGGKINTGDQLREIVAFAIAAGRPILLGDVDPDADAPWDEQADLTCAEAIRKCLAWTPGVVAWFDYSTEPYPTLHFHRSASREPLAFDIGGAPVHAVRVNPRHDLRRSVVVLKYEQTHSIDEATWTTLTTDKYPADVPETAVGAVCMTLTLGGARAAFQKQEVQTQAISENAATWWQEKLPWLSGVQSLTITGGAKAPTTYASELLSGSVAPWMGKSAAKLQVTAKASYTRLADPSLPFNALTNPIVESAREVPIATTVIGTDAATKTYSRLTALAEAEPVPAGLAQALFESVGALQYEGTLELLEPECACEVGPRHLLGLAGGLEEWAGMDANVQEVREELDAGRTLVKFGPPAHLAPEDLLALVRVNRQRVPSFSAPARSQGKASSQGDVEGGVHGRDQNASAGAPTLERFAVWSGTERIQLDTKSGATSLVLKNSTSASVTIDLAAANNKAIALREIDVCQDGVAKKMMVLCSAAY